MDCFLYDWDLLHKRVKSTKTTSTLKRLKRFDVLIGNSENVTTDCILIRSELDHFYLFEGKLGSITERSIHFVHFEIYLFDARIKKFLNRIMFQLS